MVRRRAAGIGALVLVAALAGRASAHAALERASPPVGSHVSASPVEVRLWFSEPLEAAFSGATISGASGQGEAGGKPSVDPADRRQLIVPIIRPLAAGRYGVTWRVVSVDGHRTEGDFSFWVAPKP